MPRSSLSAGPAAIAVRSEGGLVPVETTEPRRVLAMILAVRATGTDGCAQSEVRLCVCVVRGYQGKGM